MTRQYYRFFCSDCQRITIVLTLFSQCEKTLFYEYFSLKTSYFIKKDVNKLVVIPTIIERSNQVERAYDLYSLLLKERIILCTGEIEDNMASSIIGQLLYLSSLSSDPIQLYINSCGGSVTAGLAIYDTMQFIDCEVSTICMGICASMASILLAGGAKGKRAALKNSEIMIHQPLGAMQGQATDLSIAAEHIQKVKDKLSSILAYHTHQPVDKILNDCERDFYLTSHEALEYGLVDQII